MMLSVIIRPFVSVLFIDIYTSHVVVFGWEFVEDVIFQQLDSRFDPS